MSLLMKGETLPPDTRWIGIPTRQVRGQAGPKFGQPDPQHEANSQSESEVVIRPQITPVTHDTAKFDCLDTKVM
jgi:hypothetical protein